MGASLNCAICYILVVCILYYIHTFQLLYIQNDRITYARNTINAVRFVDLEYFKISNYKNIKAKLKLIDFHLLLIYLSYHNSTRNLTHTIRNNYTDEPLEEMR